jgi:pyrroline-5-carboxylate reductase
MNLCFIGGGNMATALIGGLLKRGWRSETIHVVDVDPAARSRLEREHRVHVHAGPQPAMDRVECVLLAVKPQHVRDAARSIGSLIGDALVITIAAGIRTTDLSRWLGGTKRIVRAMPNTPALVLAGVTGLYAGDGISGDDRAHAERILAAAGRTLWVEREEQIDAITAVSGSGPAYVFYFIESLEKAARELGLGEAAARLLALETFTGAAKLASEGEEAPATLRARVTSRGGTTERALAVLDEYRVQDAIVRAAHAAAERSRELGDAFAADENHGNH